MSILKYSKIQLYSYKDFEKLQKLQLLKETSLFNFLDKKSGYFALVEEDVNIEGNLIVDHLFDEIRKRFNLDDSNFIQLIWFSGNVQIQNTLQNIETEHYSDALVFENEFKAKNVVVGGTSLYFLKKIDITQVFYTRLNSEGSYSTKGAEKSINIEVDNNQIWTVNGNNYNLGFDDIEPKILDKIFIDKNDFFYFDDDTYYALEEDDDFIEALLQDKKIFKN